jgi:hypothetical protein
VAAVLLTPYWCACIPGSASLGSKKEKKKGAKQESDRAVPKKRKAEEDAEDDIVALKARLAALERENKQLRQNGAEKPKKVQSQETTGDKEAKKLKKGSLAHAGASDSAAPTAEEDAARKDAKTKKKEEMRQKMVLKRAERKRRKADARAVREAEAGLKKEAEDKVDQGLMVDVTAWKPFSLHPMIERALALKV